VFVAALLLGTWLTARLEQLAARKRTVDGELAA
jgi:hypothetical protein